MKTFFLNFPILLKKDLTLELRGSGVAVPLLCYLAFVSVLLSLGVELSQVTSEVKEKLFPSLLWFGFFISAVSVLERGAYFERELDAVSGLIVSDRVSPSAFFLSKATIHFILLILGFLTLYLMNSALMGVPMRSGPALWSIAIQGVLGFSLVCTLFSFATVTSKMRGTLLGLILIPLLFPLYLTLVELFSEIFVSGAIEDGSPWLSLLVALNAIYLTAGINLFEFIVKE